MHKVSEFSGIFWIFWIFWTRIWSFLDFLEIGWGDDHGCIDHEEFTDSDTGGGQKVRTSRVVLPVAGNLFM